MDTAKKKAFLNYIDNSSQIRQYLYPSAEEETRAPLANNLNKDAAINETSLESRQRLPEHYRIKKHNKKFVDEYLAESEIYNFTVLPPELQNYIWDFTGSTRKQYENDILGYINPMMVHDEVHSHYYQDDAGDPYGIPSYFDKKYSHPFFTSKDSGPYRQDSFRFRDRLIRATRNNYIDGQRRTTDEIRKRKGIIRSRKEQGGVEESKSI